MTEPDDAPDVTSEPAEAAGAVPAETTPEPAGDVLDSLKSEPDAADNPGMSDGPGGRPRLDWHPVTDSGGGSGGTGSGAAGHGGAVVDRSSFQFDLGGALSRLGDPSSPGSEEPPDTSASPETPERVVTTAPEAPGVEPQVAEPGALPVRGRSQSASDAAVTDTALPQRPVTSDPAPLPQRSSPPPAEVPVARVAAPDEALPRRSAGSSPAIPVSDPRPSAPPPTAQPSVQPATPPPVRRTPPSTRPSVFESGAAPVLPNARPSVAPTPSEGAEPAVAASTTQPTAAAPVMPTLPDGPRLPTLPPAAVVAPAIAAPIDSAPSTPDLHALRSAQLRASRNQRSGKLVSRTLLAFLVVGGLIAAALMFGRDYLFPVSWDSALTPIVDEIEQAHGAEFEHTVALVRQPADAYALTASGLIIDPAWVNQVPQWRALGLTSGDPTPNSIAPVLASTRLAVYDADADRVYLDADADPVAARPDLRAALEAAYAAQFDVDSPAAVVDEHVGFTGVSSPSQIARAAVFHYLADRLEEDAGAVVTPDLSGLPLPIAYELQATQSFGEPLLVAAGSIPTEVDFVTELPSTLGDALDDQPSATTSGVLQVGERALADAVSLGTDDWSMVWGIFLPPSTVDRLTRAVLADSYRPIDRSGVTCAVGVFQTGSEDDANFVLTALTGWASAAGAAAQATAVLSTPTRVQLVSCDPGAANSVTSVGNPVAALVNRQLSRLQA